MPRKKKAAIIAVANQKGGVAKTTSVASLAAAFAEHGKRVLLIDLDPQANATTALGIDPESVTRTAGSVMLREVTLAEAIVPTEVEHLSVVPASDVLDRQRIHVGPQRRERLVLGGVEAQRHHERIRAEIPDVRDGGLQRLAAGVLGEFGVSVVETHDRRDDGTGHQQTDGQH